jgi:asparagine synthase (glutamine-hydrolysing)
VEVARVKAGGGLVNAIGYFGGSIARCTADNPRPLGPFAGQDEWDHQGLDQTLFLQARGEPCRLFTYGDLAVLVRGYVLSASSPGPPNAARVADEVAQHYREHGDLPIERLEGGFTLAVLDGRAERLLLYRNLIGNGFTYYRETAGGLLFASNLAELVAASGSQAQANRAALPAFFLYRFVPGRETLFDGYFRLMPGELLTFDARGLRRVQRQVLSDLRGPQPIRRDAVDALEETMGRIFADYAALRPRAANLLSGGVDSSSLQVHWNRAARGKGPPVSFALSVDHPQTQADNDYALSAARLLGTQHTFVPADRPYASYLLDALAATGEPPNHVQSAYFGQLAEAMASHGVTTGLCGEGADSLFGVSSMYLLQNAALLRRLVPLGLARRGGERLAAWAGWERLRYYLHLADRLHCLEDLDHPVNHVAVFTEWPLVEACFGRPAVAAAAAYRRALLDQYDVPADALQQLHAVGFLGEAMDSASLWTTLFNSAGADLLCPFLDSRMLRLALTLDPRQRYPFRRPKHLLKAALVRHAPAELAHRPKLGFGQPIFEWLAPGGQLRPLAERIGAHEFLHGDILRAALARPGWFLSSLVCYDNWHRLFIGRGNRTCTTTGSQPECGTSKPRASARSSS